ncbi:hypothetical protein DFA_06124 [Cavenderia fasciculata]|uniref:Glucose-methanol-choline oxidoreductase N-terminal domain-containing protein n=1 Tax=Cavenderia fasciculata TaxID=261658 RepID=F4PK62_CACFS|nr:uncharacterized protein DFA_06124 [Cavenderia fasciculata]EGG23986.1 hypothetical protein DFA_06124 [Cavenderia fasciculata]|eukprot:XP_004361837.1 hypothetical protein DFA_06124 [Cavenderia fasciculata]
MGNRVFLLLLVLLLFINLSKCRKEDGDGGTPKCTDDHHHFEVDYLVLGAGTAGSIMASKLSEDPNTKVLLVERGEWDTSPYIYNISNWYYRWLVKPDPLYSHTYVGEPEPNFNGERPRNVVGTMVGGCSSHNGMVANSGSAERDYDEWGEMTDAKENWSGDIAKERLKEFMEIFPLTYMDRNRTWMPEMGQAIESPAMGYTFTTVEENFVVKYRAIKMEYEQQKPVKGDKDNKNDNAAEDNKTTSMVKVKGVWVQLNYRGWCWR